MTNTPFRDKKFNHNFFIRINSSRIAPYIKFLCALSAFIIFLSSASILEAADLSIPEGTLVKISLETPLSSKTNKKGEMVKFTVIDPVKIGSKTVIAKGALAQAQITEVRGPGKFGRNARLKLKFLFVLDKKGKQVPISLGEESAKINKQEGYAIGASAGGFLLLGPIGLLGGAFVKGKHIELEKGEKLFVETIKK